MGVFLYIYVWATWPGYYQGKVSGLNKPPTTIHLLSVFVTHSQPIYCGLKAFIFQEPNWCLGSQLGDYITQA